MSMWVKYATPEGYAPMAVTGVDTSEPRYFHLTEFSLASSQVNVTFYNAYAGSNLAAQVYVQVAFVRVNKKV